MKKVSVAIAGEVAQVRVTCVCGSGENKIETEITRPRPPVAVKCSCGKIFQAFSLPDGLEVYETMSTEYL